MTIHDYAETYYPTHFATGKWGCCLVGFEGVTVEELAKDKPHGFLVNLSEDPLSEDYSKRYWFWLNHD